MNTLLLDVGAWDLTVDSAGDIALATVPYARAQDVASAIRTFAAEAYYDTTLGVPYFAQILGHTPPLTLFEEYMVAAAKTVPGVVDAICTIQSFVNRKVEGQVLFTDIDSNQQAVELS